MTGGLWPVETNNNYFWEKRILRIRKQADKNVRRRNDHPGGGGSFWTNGDLVRCHNLPNILCANSTAVAVTFYICGTNRRSSNRISEHIPKWLAKSISQNTVNNYPDRDPGLSVAKHWITIKHTVDPTACFKLLLHNTERKILDYSEATLIRLRNPAVFILG